MPKAQSVRKSRARVQAWKAARSHSPPGCTCCDAREQKKTLSEPRQILEGLNSRSHLSFSCQST